MLRGIRYVCGTISAPTKKELKAFIYGLLWNDCFYAPLSYKLDDLINELEISKFENRFMIEEKQLKDIVNKINKEY